MIERSQPRIVPEQRRKEVFNRLKKETLPKPNFVIKVDSNDHRSISSPAVNLSNGGGKKLSHSTVQQERPYQYQSNDRPVSREQIRKRIEHQASAVFPKQKNFVKKPKNPAQPTQRATTSTPGEVYCEPFLLPVMQEPPLRPLWTHKINLPFPPYPDAPPTSYLPDIGQIAALAASYLPNSATKKPLTEAQKRRNNKKLAKFQKKKELKYGKKADESATSSNA